MIATNKKQPGTLTRKMLEGAVLAKAFEFVEQGKMKKAHAAIKSIMLMDVQSSQAAPPEPVRRTESPQIEVDQQIDALLAGEYHAFDDQDALAFFSKRWVSVKAAAEFASKGEDAVRIWCNGGNVVCRLKEATKKKEWLVCPRSVGLKINGLADPRLTPTID